MSWLPGFEYDVFVSYARIDDVPNDGEERGWVTVLKDNLRTWLDRRLGTKSSIWMDPRLVAEERITAPILDGLNRSASLLAIVSPAYLNSPWCGRERGSFLDRVQDAARPRPIFIAECDDLETAPLPGAFQDRLRVKFWQREADGGATRRLGDPLPTPEDRAYWDHLADLSFKIEKVLRKCRDEKEGTAPAQDAPAVFVAEVTDDLLEDCERLQRSLAQAGITVVPDRAYPRDAPEAFAAAMRDDLARCKVFVQLLGEYPGRVRGWNKSLAALQYETAKRAGVPIQQRRRFELTDVKDDEHRALVFGPSVVNDSLEVFIAGIVKAAQYQEPAEAPAPDGSVLVFVDHDQDDARFGVDLCQFFDRQGLGYVRPGAFDTADAMRAELEDNLKLCDALVLVYGRSQATWVRSQLREAIKIKSVRQKPLAQVVLCHGEPAEEKADPGIKLPNQRIVDCRRGLDDQAQRGLMDFIRCLREAAR
jgi:hypothetical protein